MLFSKFLFTTALAHLISLIEIFSVNKSKVLLENSLLNCTLIVH